MPDKKAQQLKGNRGKPEFTRDSWHVLRQSTGVSIVTVMPPSQTTDFVAFLQVQEDDSHLQRAEIIALAPSMVKALRAVALNNSWHPGDANTKSGTVAIDCDVVRFVHGVLDAVGGQSNVVAKHTPNGYDRRWLACINGVLEDRESDIRITDIDERLWDDFLGPLVDAIQDGDYPDLDGGGTLKS